jgi:glycosyltransferase involved in cell wall biosynthesis
MMAKKIQGLVSQIEFDVVIIEHTIMGLYLEALPPALRKRTAWLLHDIDYDKLKRISHLEPGTIRKLQLKGRSIMMRSWMPRFADRFGLCVTVSDMDRRLLVSANDRLKVEVSPNGVDTHRYNPLPEEEGAPALLFVGNMGYGPNIDAVDYFCRRILPLVQRGVPDTELWIVGTNPPARVKALCGGAVHVTGGVEHIEPYYSRCKVCIVPLRAGSGTRLKILEAMALARPVVSTTLGCEGLDVADGVHVLLADSAQGFAEKTVELLVKPELRRRLAAKARELVVSRYDWDTIAERLQEILSQLKNESVASAALAPPTFTVDSFQPR